MDFKAFIFLLFILLLQDIPVHCAKESRGSGKARMNLHGNPHGNQHGNPHVNPEIENVASCPEILGKRNWGGRDPFKVFYTILPVEYVIIHHTFTTGCYMGSQCVPIVKELQNFHMDELEYNDIAFNFLIGCDGSIYEGVGWHRRGNHTYGYDNRSIGIAFIGNYNNFSPTQVSVEAAKHLIECGISNNELSKDVKVYAARQVESTQSPGLHLLNNMRTWPHFVEH
ncbi:peptidoglycan recognition protein-like [Phlebotomus papatasi]|uniref:peptidoglycan recognition protein-like n=1 Tax=Phlebotomus papatasi TaxID=29031 RepID=UPI0024834F6B|nr:peptidoglycan recognition protein-like [Phlebotomus papatasi]